MNSFSGAPPHRGVRASPRATTSAADRQLGVRLAFAAIGFTPILALALSLTGAAPLHLGAPILLGAALLTGGCLAVSNSWCRPAVMDGLGAGLLAVLIYDGTRLPFVLLGRWPDFIPKIGVWLLRNPDTHWTVGYTWRYLGNGAGMGLAFMMLAPYTRRWIDPRAAGVAFGLFVWSGLLTTWALTPNSAEQLFALTPAAFALSLMGHIVYGTVLGLCWAHQLRRRPFREIR